MEIILKRYCDWSVQVRKRLMYATFPNGLLRRYVRVANRSAAFVAFSKRQIMGWAFILNFRERKEVNIYINERYRNKGIATQLIEEAINEFGLIYLTAWDEKTWKLFKKLQRKHPGKIRILDWDKHCDEKEGWLQTLLI